MGRYVQPVAEQGSGRVWWEVVLGRQSTGDVCVCVCGWLNGDFRGERWERSGSVGGTSRLCI